MTLVLADNTHLLTEGCVWVHFLLITNSIICIYSMNIIKVYNIPEGVVEGSVDIGEYWIVEEFTSSFPVVEIRSPLPVRNQQ